MRDIDPDLIYKGMHRPAMLAGMPYPFIIIAVMISVIVFLITRNFLVFGGMLTLSWITGILLGRLDPFLAEILVVKVRHFLPVKNYMFWKCNSYDPE